MFQPRRGSLDAHLFENRLLDRAHRCSTGSDPGGTVHIRQKDATDKLRMDFIEFPGLRAGTAGPRVPISVNPEKGISTGRFTLGMRTTLLTRHALHSVT